MAGSDSLMRKKTLVPCRAARPIEAGAEALSLTGKKRNECSEFPSHSSIKFARVMQNLLALPSLVLAAWFASLPPPRSRLPGLLFACFE